MRSRKSEPIAGPLVPSESHGATVAVDQPPYLHAADGISRRPISVLDSSERRRGEAVDGAGDRLREGVDGRADTLGRRPGSPPSGDRGGGRAARLDARAGRRGRGASGKTLARGPAWRMRSP